jgi:hypothetical protein
VAFEWSTAPWISEDDLITPAGCEECHSKSSTEFVTAVIERASEALYILTGRTIGYVTGEIHLDLTTGLRAGDSINLPGPDPQIVSVELDEEPLSAVLEIRDGRLVLGDWATGVDEAVISLRSGPPVPAIAKAACVDLVCHILANPSPWCGFQPGTTSASFQGTSVTIDPAAVREAGIGSVRSLMDMVNPANQRQPSVCVTPDDLDLEVIDLQSVPGS